MEKKASAPFLEKGAGWGCGVGGFSEPRRYFPPRCRNAPNGGFSESPNGDLCEFASSRAVNPWTSILIVGKSVWTFLGELAPMSMGLVTHPSNGRVRSFGFKEAY